MMIYVYIYIWITVHVPSSQGAMALCWPFTNHRCQRAKSSWLTSQSEWAVFAYTPLLPWQELPRDFSEPPLVEWLRSADAKCQCQALLLKNLFSLVTQSFEAFATSPGFKRKRASLRGWWPLRGFYQTSAMAWVLFLCLGWRKRIFGITRPCGLDVGEVRPLCFCGCLETDDGELCGSHLEIAVASHPRLWHFAFAKHPARKVAICFAFFPASHVRVVRFYRLRLPCFSPSPRPSSSLRQELFANSSAQWA